MVSGSEVATQRSHIQMVNLKQKNRARLFARFLQRLQHQVTPSSQQAQINKKKTENRHQMLSQLQQYYWLNHIRPILTECTQSVQLPLIGTH